MKESFPISNNQPAKLKRIDSIDALRAFALFGILLVHLSQLYNFDNSYNQISWYTPLGLNLKHLLSSVFMGRSRNIFCILFGVSFYLILRNPTYSTTKFCWRCILLMCFGFINIIFFSTDILWWYGLNGIFLALFPIRSLQPKYILFTSILLYIYSLIQIPHLNDLIFPEYDYSSRYIINMSLSDYLHYPYFQIVKEQLHTFTGGSTETLALFTLGYYLGKKGVIEQIDNIVKIKLVSLSFVIYALTRIIYQISNYSTVWRQLSEISGAFFYAILFIFVFNYCKKWLFPLTNYGRLGLTNYTSQNIIWPIILLTVFIPQRISFEYVLLCGIVFYIIQIIFSYWWTKEYKFGPMEYIWRIATHRRFTNNKKTQ